MSMRAASTLSRVEAADWAPVRYRKGAAPPPDAVRAQLERLRRSPAFARSVSLFGFLRFVVEEALTGQGDRLKELVIGDALYGRRMPYDPRIESTVRVEARRLRRKLREHYETVGCDDPVRIELPLGSYRPGFTCLADAGKALIPNDPA